MGRWSLEDEARRGLAWKRRGPLLADTRFWLADYANSLATMKKDGEF